jgi:plasmid stabilization system protein ParE
MNVVVTVAAKLDLIEIGDFIARDNPTRATSFVDELLDRCHELTDQPRAYPLVPRYEHWDVRRRAYRDYLIFYRLMEDHLEICTSYTAPKTTRNGCFLMDK